jgi:hypothetical protein
MRPDFWMRRACVCCAIRIVEQATVPKYVGGRSQKENKEKKEERGFSEKGS